MSDERTPMKQRKLIESCFMCQMCFDQGCLHPELITEEEAFDKPFKLHDDWERSIHPNCPLQDAVAVPERIKGIAQEMRTQDNHCVDPIWIVEREERINSQGDCPIDSEGRFEWINADTDDCTDPTCSHENCTKLYYMKRWTFASACFTEAGCEDYRKTEGKRNLGATRVLARGSHRNDEWKAVREFLLGIGEEVL